MKEDTGAGVAHSEPQAAELARVLAVPPASCLAGATHVLPQQAALSPSLAGMLFRKIDVGGIRWVRGCAEVCARNIDEGDLGPLGAPRISIMRYLTW